MLRYCGTPREAGAPRDFRQAYSTVSPYVCPADRPRWQESWTLLRTLRVESGQRYNGVVRSGKRVCWFLQVGVAMAREGGAEKWM